MNEKELALELEKWFKLVKIDHNFWNRNPVAKIIKSKLKEWKHFKCYRRGNPAKGGRKKKYNKARREGYEGEFEG